MIFVIRRLTGWPATRPMPLTDVQWVLGHAHLSTTQLYLTAPDEDVIAAVVAHHARRQGGACRAGRCGGRSRVPAGVAERAVRAGATVSGAGRAGPAAVTGPAGGGLSGVAAVAGRPGPVGGAVARFPPRPAPASWALTSQPKPQVLERLLAPPFPTGARTWTKSAAAA